MTHPRLRRSVRALIIAPDESILLARHRISAGFVWAAPGGGVELGETIREALERELMEELGLDIRDLTAQHVWHQEFLDDSLSGDFDGVINDYFVVRHELFDQKGSFSDAVLFDEGLEAFKWWSVESISDAAPTHLFSPRDLANLLAQLLRAPDPVEPVEPVEPQKLGL